MPVLDGTMCDMVKRSSAEELRARMLRGMRRGGGTALVNPHGNPERGGTGYLPRERQQALNRYRDGVRVVGLWMSDRTLRRWSKRAVDGTLENV